MNPSAQSTLVALGEKWRRVPMVWLRRTLCAAGGPGTGCGSSLFCFRHAATQYFLLNCFMYGIEESLFSPEAAQFRWPFLGLELIAMTSLTVLRAVGRGGCPPQRVSEQVVLGWGCTVCWFLSGASGVLSPAFVCLAHVPSHVLQMPTRRTKHKLAVSG